MELKVLDAANIEKGKKTLPKQFSEEVRPDLIRRAVLSLQSRSRQAYGADPRAGLRASAEVSRRRHNYRGSYGFGISRVPRKVLSRRGTRMFWVGAVAPGTVGGRRAHPPKADKIWEQKINKKEKRKAIRSAISATIVKELVQSRGHRVPDKYPFILDSKTEAITKTADVNNAFVKLGLDKELERSAEKKVRAGKGTSRGRKYRTKKGLLLVVSKDCKLLKAATNIAGVDVSIVNELNAEVLAPGADVGRITLFTEAALDRLEKERLFTDNPVVKKESKSKTQEKEKVEKKIEN